MYITNYIHHCMELCYAHILEKNTNMHVYTVCVYTSRHKEGSYARCACSAERQGMTQVRLSRSTLNIIVLVKRFIK